MALFITEYAALASDSFSYGLAAALEPAVAEQALTPSGTSGASAAFNERTSYVMLHAQEAVCLKWGTAPVAVTTAQRIGAGETRFVGVPMGKSFKVACITSA